MRLKQRGCAQNPQTITRLMRGEQVVFLEIRFQGPGHRKFSGKRAKRSNPQVHTTHQASWVANRKFLQMRSIVMQGNCCEPIRSRAFAVRQNR
ncbi:hypothetical protein K227x_32670 [Rubripirellula lacrimiformis]|uniref:Uncharacterized protein n=1 Tax=Rubripirellula lacrimiformis TaxID=1930273 RepID=A0A517NCM0_9BACT|nr:hypothetical protein K227x_32670 [Rubripirellula lacrimiformis]